ncbi:CPBP family intramembrane glutamic endopeptidase [Curtobacterium sp. MCBD17_026]|uniref:CPBP family intramembrane glutamic endopeptidase n=1 Tax=Curtobacterium sp. MCBD17_026 TaxID=2175621 RepID=UPI0011B695C0|nr:CPBP family intramembrane glutamic endopeptidase [Curtobacterium sp. MCBD17_026]WIB72602.1 CPBP family intramembrane metalloprotease [Curtobacterium sp. MCBD17_026]
MNITPVNAAGRGTMRVAAWLSIAFVVAWGWGYPTYLAITVRFGATPPDRVHDSSAAGIWHELIKPYGIVWTSVLVVAAAVLIRAFGGRPRRRTAWAGGALTVPIGILVMGLAFGALTAVSDVLGLTQSDYLYSEVEGTGALIVEGVDFALAGPAEELALLGLVVVALRRADVRWRWVVLVAIIVRIPFHLYYGWGVIAFAFWPLVFVYLYRRTGAIWGLVLAHTLYDVAAVLATRDVIPDATDIRDWLARLALLVIALVAVIRLALRKD